MPSTLNLRTADGREVGLAISNAAEAIQMRWGRWSGYKDMREAMAAFAKALDGTDVATWTPPVALAATRAFGATPSVRNGTVVPGTNANGATNAASVRLAWALVMRDPTALNAGEEEEVVRDLASERSLTPHLAGLLARVAASGKARVDGGAAGPFRHRFVWDRSVALNSVPTWSTALSSMGRLDAADAPVACRLATMAGHTLDVRSAPDGLYRPLLAPGSWRPIGTDEFIAAAGDGVAWVDSPFVPHQNRSGPVMPVDAYARPEPTRLSWNHAGKRDLTAANVGASVGELMDIGGIVHRRCTAPELFVVIEEGGRRSRLSWVIPGQVAQGDDMTALRIALPAGRPMFAERHQPDRPLPWSRASLVDAGSLARVAAPVLRGMVDRGYLAVDHAFDEASCHEVVLSDALASDPARIHEAMAGALGTFPHRFDGSPNPAIATASGFHSRMATAMREGNLVGVHVDDVTVHWPELAEEHRDQAGLARTLYDGYAREIALAATPRGDEEELATFTP